jgi:hypothetical protein
MLLYCPSDPALAQECLGNCSFKRIPAHNVGNAVGGQACVGTAGGHHKQGVGAIPKRKVGESRGTLATTCQRSPQLLQSVHSYPLVSDSYSKPCLEEAGGQLASTPDASPGTSVTEDFSGRVVAWSPARLEMETPGFGGGGGFRNSPERRPPW